MNDIESSASPEAQAKPVSAIKALRESRGGVPKELTARNKAHAKIRKDLAAALADGPRTVPELAATTGIPTVEVMWWVMALKKYGQVVEGVERDSYLEYALKPQQEKDA